MGLKRLLRGSTARSDQRLDVTARAQMRLLRDGLGRGSELHIVVAIRIRGLGGVGFLYAKRADLVSFATSPVLPAEHEPACRPCIVFVRGGAILLPLPGFLPMLEPVLQYSFRHSRHDNVETDSALGGL